MRAGPFEIDINAMYDVEYARGGVGHAVRGRLMYRQAAGTLIVKSDRGDRETEIRIDDVLSVTWVNERGGW